MSYAADPVRRTVDASIAGLLGSRAAFHEGLGCVLLHGSVQPYVLKSDIAALKNLKEPPLLPEIAGAAIVEPSDVGLKAALDHAFAEPAAPPFRRTKAVVVVQDGRVIAERYADVFGVELDPDTQVANTIGAKEGLAHLMWVLVDHGDPVVAPTPAGNHATEDKSAEHRHADELHRLHLV